MPLRLPFTAGDQAVAEARKILGGLGVTVPPRLSRALSIAAAETEEAVRRSRLIADTYDALHLHGALCCLNEHGKLSDFRDEIASLGNDSDFLGQIYMLHIAACMLESGGRVTAVPRRHAGAEFMLSDEILVECKTRHDHAPIDRPSNGSSSEPRASSMTSGLSTAPSS